MTEANLGRSAARTRLKQNATDEDALFFLGKINLNSGLGFILRLWTQDRLERILGSAQARLDTVLKMNPQHVRASSGARVDSTTSSTRRFRAPRDGCSAAAADSAGSTRFATREAAQADCPPPYVQAEAMFALWDMQVRERNLADAIVVARALARDFPDNRELTKFLYTYADLQGRR